MASLLDDPSHWRMRAAEARVIAAEMKDPEARRTMLEVATHYDVLAKRAERRGGRTPTKK